MHDATALPRKISRERLAEPESSNVATEPLGAQPQPHDDGTDVARLHNDVIEGQRFAVDSHVRHRGAPHPDRSRADVKQLVPSRDSFFEGGRRGHQLEGRPRFVDVLNGPIPARTGIGGGKHVGVERGPVGHRQHLAGVWRHHDNRSRLSAVLLYGPPELSLGDVLQVGIERELERGTRRRGSLQPAEGSTPGISLDKDLPGTSGDLVVIGRLDPAQPLVVDTDVAEDV